jgi:hypothetical protein
MGFRATVTKKVVGVFVRFSFAKTARDERRSLIEYSGGGDVSIEV